MRSPAHEAIARAQDAAGLAAIELGDPDSIADAAIHSIIGYVEECAGTMPPHDFEYELQTVKRETGPYDYRRRS